MSAFERLAAAQHKHPWRFLAVALAVTVAMLPLVLRLRLNSDFTALLPESAPSVKDLDKIEARFAGLATLTVAVSGDDLDEVHAFARRLAPRLEALKEEKVVAVDWNVSEMKKFVDENKTLYCPKNVLVEAHDVLKKRLDWELNHANPASVDLLDDEEDPKPDTKAELEKLQHQGDDAKKQLDKFPDGFFQHPKQKMVFLFLRTSLVGGEMDGVQKLLAAVKREAKVAGPGKLRITYGGDVMDAFEEQQALTDAALLSLGITIVLVFGAIVLYYRRARALMLLGLMMLPPLALTFGIGALLVKYLNASTAFLSSIVIGNGINAPIVWLARYFEARRKGRDVAEAVTEAHHGAWRGTMTASLAAATSYAALVITQFRGFRDFGIIGGIGMTLCWVSTMLVLPPLCVAYERWRPMPLRARGHGGRYSAGVAAIARHQPRAVLWAAIGVSAVASLAIALRVAGNPLETDFRNLESRKPAGSASAKIDKLQGEVVDETTTGSSIAVLAPARADVPVMKKFFEDRRASFDHAYGPLRTLDDYLPVGDQAAKLDAIRDLRKILVKLKKYATEKELTDIEANMPPEDPKVIGDADIPDVVARPFIEKDGTRGRILYMEHDPTQSQFDGRYLERWTEAARTVRIDGKRPAVAGRPPVFADLQRAIYIDGPKAVLFAFGTTAMLVFLTFRRGRDRAFTLGSLLVGVLVMTGACAALGLKLNFLNFVAFPVTFGIGSDYAVNVMRRFVEEEERGAPPGAAIDASIHETGGAVILCSLTTIIGYLSLFTSPNRALNSFGTAMVISEIACLAAAVLVLPAVLRLILHRGLRRAPGRATMAE